METQGNKKIDRQKKEKSCKKELSASDGNKKDITQDYWFCGTAPLFLLSLSSVEGARGD